MLQFRLLAYKALKHIILYFLLDIAPLEGLFEILMQFIPTQLH